MNTENISHQSKRTFGKVGLLLIAVGFAILFYDSYQLTQMFPTDYQFINHPAFHVPIIGMIIIFTGTAIFIHNFLKGDKVL